MVKNAKLLPRKKAAPRIARSERLPSKVLPWLQMASGIFAVLAFFMSAFAIYSSEQRRRIDIPFDVVPRTYQRYYEMNNIELQRPYLTHIFVTPDRYPDVKNRVRDALPAPNRQKKAELLLEERAAADFIFTFYEQTFFQVEATRADTQTYEFINRVLRYLREDLLRNPRLIYWWHERLGGLETSYEAKTRDDWAKYVFKNISTENEDWCDAAGPFDINVQGELTQHERKCRFDHR